MSVMKVKRHAKIPSKVVQITVHPNGQIVALCADGTIWQRGPDLRGGETWLEIKLGPAVSPKNDD